MYEIDSPDSLQGWLQDKPANWAQAIAMRASLRAVPMGLSTQAGFQDLQFATLFRAPLIAWVACSDPSEASVIASRAASRAIRKVAPDVVAYVHNQARYETTEIFVTAAAQAAANAAAYAGVSAIAEVSDATRWAVEAAEGMADGATWATGIPDFAASVAWKTVQKDAEWLSHKTGDSAATSKLSGRPLWWGYMPGNLYDQWTSHAKHC